jgi:hypothetical protein
MNEVIKAARAKGVFIIHCPSDTMDFYKDFPQRKLAQAAPVVKQRFRWNAGCISTKLARAKSFRLMIPTAAVTVIRR